MGLFIRPCKQDVIGSFRVFEHSGGGNYERVFHHFRGHGKFHAHAGFQRGVRLGGFDPYFNRRTAGIESGTDQTDMAFDGLVKTGDFHFRGISHFQNRGFRLRNVRLGDEPGRVHHDKDGLIGVRQIPFIKGAIRHNAVNGAANFRVAELRLGSEHATLRRFPRTLSGLQTLFLAHASQIRKLLLRLLVLAAGLKQSDFGQVQLASRQSALLKKLLAAVVDFLLRIKRGLCGRSIEFRLLDLLWEASIHRVDIGRISLFEVSLARQCRTRQVAVLEFDKQLPFFYARASLDVESLYG